MRKTDQKCQCDRGKLPSAQALDLVKQIQHSAGAIVSRTIVDKKAGTVTLFAFDVGQGLSEHSAPYDALVQVLSGEALLTIGGKEVKAHAGQLVIMPANVPHSVKAVRRFKMLLTMIRNK